MTQEERDEIIFVCSLRTIYTEEYLRNLSDSELLEIYNKEAI